jgi:hypothetical protein
MKGAFGNEGALPLFVLRSQLDEAYASGVVVDNADR